MQITKSPNIRKIIKESELFDKIKNTVVSMFLHRYANNYLLSIFIHLTHDFVLCPCGVTQIFERLNRKLLEIGRLLARLALLDKNP